MNFIKYLMLIIIPSLTVLLCLTFKLAQGEKVEEIVFGLMLGVVLDVIYLIVLFFVRRKNSA